MNTQERSVTPPRDSSSDTDSFGMLWTPRKVPHPTYARSSTRTWAETRLSTQCATSEGPRRRPRLVERLRKRMISRWVISYVAVAWVTLQLLDVLADIWAVPLAIQRTITLIVGLGVFPSLVVAWYHGERGRQKVCCSEIVILTAAIAGSILILLNA